MAAHDISQRRACRLIGVDPKTVRRARVPDNPEIRQRMHAIAGERRRFGYRRVGLMSEREGVVMNHKKLRRIYSEEKLQVKRRRGRKRARGTRTPMRYQQVRTSDGAWTLSPMSLESDGVFAFWQSMTISIVSHLP